MKRISSPLETITRNASPENALCESEHLIIGSGYGGAVAAMRLAIASSGAKRDTSHSVLVLERGQEYLPGDFPYDIEDIPSHMRIVQSADAVDAGTNGYADALFNLHIGSDSGASGEGSGSAVDVLVGSGLGGTSLINANVAEEPAASVFRKPQWPQEFREADAPLKDAFEQVRRALNVTTRTGKGGQTFGKYSALEKIATAADANVEPATIAVNTRTGINRHGVAQPACSDCGNCITGCNTGAKNTLDRNLLRSAHKHGATFYTGATVVSLEETPGSQYRWKVYVTPTFSPEVNGQRETFFISTNNVVLAAGTLGSTEILMRSQARGALQLSPCLGQHFSSNGDGIALTYGQSSAVDSIAEPEQKRPAKHVGPTITGIIKTRGLTIEDASVPASMARVFAELTTTGAMLQRLANRSLPRVVEKSGQDPLAASLQMAQHSQALLIMGDDGAPGRLSFSAENDRVTMHFPDAGENPALVGADKLLSAMDRKKGLDGGQYVPNPLWKLLPDGADDALAGTLPASRALTVHPLGGCAMGDSVADGVVNHAGQVFNNGGGLYPGLYVFDGAVVPSALGINPFLTIAALAWRNCGLLLKAPTTAWEAQEYERTQSPELVESIEDAVPERQRAHRQPVQFAIDEQMLGELPALPNNFSARFDAKALQRLREKDGLVIGVTATHDNAEQWLENPGAMPLRAQMKLYINPISTAQVNDFRPVGVRDELINGGATELLALDGTFTILREDEHSTLADFMGGIAAICSYRARRTISKDIFSSRAGFSIKGICESLHKAYVFYNIGTLQSRLRRMRYNFYNKEYDILVSGEKVLGFQNRLPRLWPALLNLDAVLQEGNAKPIAFKVSVNTEKLLDPGLIKVTASPDLPHSLLFAGGLASFFARTLLTSNFWEFGGVDVPEVPHQQRTVPRALATSTGLVEPSFKELIVPVRRSPSGHEEGAIPLLLTNYRNPGKPPVLMLHGLAQGSQIFWTDSLKNNLANYFYDAGFDVWLVDYRLSNHVLPNLEDKSWCIDEIAEFDIPYAIRAVLRATGQQQLSIVAHCVGACGLAMATLRDKTLGAKVSAAVTNAIHPWVLASPGNRFRAKLGGVYREWVPQAMLNPIASANDAAIQNVTDRIGFGLSRIEEEPEDDHQHVGDDPIVNGICDRMTFLYGRMWNHRNLSRDTHNAFKDMLGPAPIGVYQHLYHYTKEERITDRDGENTYLTQGNIEQGWTFPVLFVHGGDSRVFNPHSARRSARRLSGVLQKKHGSSAPSIGYKIYPGYGHMDVIFGKDAHRECYGDYVAFIRNPASAEDPGNAPDWRPDATQQFMTGPILRAAWIHNDSLRLRYWGELRGGRSAGLDKVIADGARIVDDQAMSLRQSGAMSSPHYRLVDLELPLAAQSHSFTLGFNGKKEDAPENQLLHYQHHAWLQQLQKLSRKQTDTMAFLVGSCRYPGSLVDNALSDKVYAAMAQHVQTADGAQLLFLTGDQIYADATDQILEVKSPKTRYTDRYRTAFGPRTSSNFAALVKQVPTHFSLDDHELTDNWSGYLKAPSPAPQHASEYALDSATRFMGAGRTQMPVTGSESENHTDSESADHRPFYYPLEEGIECCFPTFIADTRAERKFRTSNQPDKYTLMSPEQLEAIRNWLSSADKRCPSAPKFLVSGSIVAPLPGNDCEENALWRQQDGWAGYPATLEALLAFIVENQILNVIFVGGDAHLAAISELTLSLPGANAVTAWQIVSSGLYSPLPFANSHREDYLWNTEHTICTHTNTQADAKLGIVCKNTFLSDEYSQFVRVDATPCGLTIRSYDANNTALAERRISLQRKPTR